MVRTVAVIGGGVSGLTAAWELSRPGSNVAVTLIEGTERVGGKLRLEEVAGVRIDVGAESVLARRPEALTALRGARCRRPDHPPRAGRCLDRRAGRPLADAARHGHGRALRPRVRAGTADRRRGATDSRTSASTAPVDGDVSVGDLVDARLGRAVTDLLVEPLLAGVYAGHAREISAEQAVPALAAAAREGRSLVDVARAAGEAALSGPAAVLPVFASLVGGLGTLPETLHRELVAAGVDVRTGVVARGLRRDADGWVCRPARRRTWCTSTSTPSWWRSGPGCSRLLRGDAPAAADALGAIEYASMAIVTLALDGPAPADLLDGSGFLVPPTEPLTIKASTFSTVKWPWLAAAHPDRTFLRASVGRHRRGGVAAAERRRARPGGAGRPAHGAGAAPAATRSRCTCSGGAAACRSTPSATGNAWPRPATSRRGWRCAVRHTTAWAFPPASRRDARPLGWS